MESSNLIRKITAILQKDLAIKVQGEYDNRMKECIYLIENKKKYKVFSENIMAIEALLAISIFFNRVLNQMESVTKFYGRVSKSTNGETSIIKIGSYELDASEIDSIKQTIIAFEEILKKYSISKMIFDYVETREFLDNLQYNLYTNEQSGENDEIPF